MPLLPAVVPVMVKRKAERVPARLAQNVAPLFGVPFAAGPFGALSWLCDFTKITVSEIARGAPSPTRADSAEFKEGPAVDGWKVHHRAVYAGAGSLPNEIVNATTNRYGPHTKAAVVLTAANVLLEPAAEAIERMLALLNAPGQKAELSFRIAAWAGALIEVYRSQPALVIAAIKARSIQRASLDGPRFPRAGTLSELRLARCEIDGSEAGSVDPATHPRDLHIFDRTVDRLELPDIGSGFADLEIPSDEEGASSAPDLADELVDRLQRLLMDAGEPEGAGHIWISEREPGQLVAEAILPASGLVDELLDYWSSIHGEFTEPTGGTPVELPATADFLRLPEYARRAFALGALAVLRRLRSRTGVPAVPVREYVALVDHLDELVAEGFGESDPASAVVRTRLGVLRVTVLRHDRSNSLDEPLSMLTGMTDRCLRLLDEGVLDRGAVADVVSAVCVELNAVRRTRAEHDGGQMSPIDLDRLLRRYWSAFAAALEVDLTEPGSADMRLIGHHLHNYAAFLGSNTESIADLVQAVDLFRSAVIPARQQLYRRTGMFGPLGRTCYVASGATTRLAETFLAAGRTDEASGWAELGYRWINRVLDDREFIRLQEGAGDQAGLFALRALNALVLAWELRVAEVGDRDIGRVNRLLSTADRWRASVTRGREENYVRNQELVLLRKRVAELTSSTQRSQGPA